MATAIQTEVTRLNSAKSAIKSALTAKGVTVPSSALLGDLATLIAKLPPASMNRVPKSVNESGGTYNSTGYKDGYRVRSGGAEAASSNTTCTGFIPVNGGDTVRIYGWNRYSNKTSSANAINACNANFETIGQVGNSDYGIFASGGGYTAYKSSTIKDGADGVSEWTVPPAASGVAYIRVSAFDNTNGAPGAKLCVI